MTHMATNNQSRITWHTNSVAVQAVDARMTHIIANTSIIQYAMISKRAVVINGMTGIPTRYEQEDGSGNGYNVYFSNGAHVYADFSRCLVCFLA
jgi:hypothetical protein